MPWFTVFDITMVKQIDELPTDNRNRKSHHHLHKDVRYSITQEPHKEQVSKDEDKLAEPTEIVDKEDIQKFVDEQKTQGWGYTKENE